MAHSSAAVWSWLGGGLIERLVVYPRIHVAMLVASGQADVDMKIERVNDTDLPDDLNLAHAPQLAEVAKALRATSVPGRISPLVVMVRSRSSRNSLAGFHRGDLKIARVSRQILCSKRKRLRSESPKYVLVSVILKARQRTWLTGSKP